ncbi:MAG: preprotein translocase subunit SecY [Acidobacteria bacterium]|nr:preprotein translocase subunit SecY [Acidobacteriota bacterium]
MDSLKNIFAIPELRKRVLFTFGILTAYRLGGHIPTPGINKDALYELTQQAAASNLFGLYDMFSGYNLSQMTVFALGVMPYISASIILQLLTVVWPYLERLSKEGELGRRKITQYTRYGTILLSVVQALGIAIFLENASQAGGYQIVTNPGWGFRLMTVLTLSTGSTLVMWLGEQITERGIGNGMSLLIYAGIVVGLPRGALATIQQLRMGSIGLFTLIILVVLMVAVVGAVVFVERGHRRVTVQYARRMVGRRLMGGTSTHIPLKVNTGGVMPVIFASSILAFPQTLKPMFAATSFADRAITQLSIGYPLYNLLYVGLIVFFAYFYTAIIFNPDDVAENMRKYGGFVPGIRPGKRTAEHIDQILARVTLAGALYLAAIALLPELLLTGFKVQPIPFIGDRLDAIMPRFITEGLGVPFYFGGTSLLIIVGVAMDTVQQVESQLIMRHYDGFMKKTRIRGRRG